MVTVTIQYPVAVITPTINHENVWDAIKSVESQTYKNVHHYLVADGKDVYQTMVAAGLGRAAPNCTLSFVPENTGANGFYGHRIYAAYPHLLDHEFIFFLDEDNWYTPTHIDSLVKLMQAKKLDFAYSLRNIHQPNGDFVIEDKCESIGKLPIFFTQDKIEKQYLIDTSAYAFTRQFIQSYCHHWHCGWGGDRRFLELVWDKGNYDTTGEHTLCYRLDDNMEKKYGSLDFFKNGNQAVFDYYGEYPWLNSQK